MRYLVIMGVAFIYCTGATLFSPVFLWGIIPMATLLCIRKTQRKTLFFVCLGILLGTVVLWVYFLRVDRFEELVEKKISVNGTVIDNKMGQTFLAEHEGELIILETRSYITKARMVEIGDEVTITASIDRIEKEYDHYLISGGVKLIATLESIVENEGDFNHFYGLLLKKRETLCKELYKWDSSEEMALLQSLLFSNKAKLSDETKENFSKSGISHLMSVSGLHISILLFSFLALLQMVHLPKTLQVLCLCFVGGLLFVLAGMSPSIFRGLIMMLFTTIATAIGRKKDGITILTLSAMALIMICPPIIIDLSFLLSHLATLGILLFVPSLMGYGKMQWIVAFGKKNKIIDLTIASIAVSVSAQILTAPVIAIVFGEVSIIGMVVNLVAIPLCYPVLLFGFLGTFFFQLGVRAIGGFVLGIAMVFVEIMANVAKITSSFAFATVNIHTGEEIVMTMVICVAVAVLIYLPYTIKKKKVLTMMILLIFPIAIGGLIMEKYHSTTVVSSKDTGSVLIYTKDGSVLISGANSTYKWEQDADLCTGYLGTYADKVVIVDPFVDTRGIKQWSEDYPADYYSLGEDDPRRVEVGDVISLWEGCQLVIVSEYMTEIWVDQINTVKYWGNYGTMTSSEEIPSKEIIVDREGNMIALGLPDKVYRNKQLSTLRVKIDEK